MKINVYIDGFNFYYGCLRGSSDKWLDFGAFCSASFPQDTIHRIRYFTARVRSDPLDPDKHVRQGYYLRALETVPNLSIHLGHFIPVTKWGMLIHPKTAGLGLVKIKTWEEKGSDVYIGAYLMMDAFRQDFDEAVIISNDADLVEPIRLVRSELQLRVGVLSPHNSLGKPSYPLKSSADFYHRVDRSLLAQCQFPTSLTDVNGTFSRPVEWDPATIT
jgi:hypothetical protein